MANRKKPTNRELLDMCLFLRERLDYMTKLSSDTAMILQTLLKLKGWDKEVFREIRKTQENEIKNTNIKENIMKEIENANKEKINKNK